MASPGVGCPLFHFVAKLKAVYLNFYRVYVSLRRRTESNGITHSVTRVPSVLHCLIAARRASRAIAKSLLRKLDAPGGLLTIVCHIIRLPLFPPGYRTHW